MPSLSDCEESKLECRIEPGPKCEEIQRLIAKTGIPMRDIQGRTIVCTASRAHYGACSHWMISIEGTPPRGTIIFDTNRYTPGVAFLLVQDRVKRLTGKAYDVVENFVAEFLAGAEY